ncbi:hypothetical protein CK227_35175 [Mesorhizobium sp. WSM4308]|nr:hypothetical protein CK232_34685 [Mesorhizobium sp. WSM4304]PBB70854.1 hypothetical protein CK227_35175 [Mesorhizobium sp. WSM4308]
MERNGLLDGRRVDSAVITELAKRLVIEAEAEGITDKDIIENWDDLHSSLIDIMRRRHPPPRSTQ